MERVRQVTLTAAVFAALGGCATADRLSHEAKRVVGLDPAAVRPASQLSIIMQRRLRSLPDAVRPDAKQAGLPGQVFLVGEDGRPTEAAGDLTLTVTDVTPRPQGQPPRTPEKWQFTRDVLPRMRVKDERFGDCYALFLPWPDDWKDVTRVTVQGHYQAANGIELFADEITINLDLGEGVIREQWEKLGAVKAAMQPNTAPPAATQPIPLPTPSPAPMLLPTPSPGPQSSPPSADGPLTVEVRRS